MLNYCTAAYKNIGQELDQACQMLVPSISWLKASACIQRASVPWLQPWPESPSLSPYNLLRTGYNALAGWRGVRLDTGNAKMTETDILIHKQAIRDLVLDYCRAIDRRDFELLSSLYAEDSFDDHGSMYQGSGSGFVTWVPEILAHMHATSHQVFNHRIHMDVDPANYDGYAEGEVYIQAYHLMNDKEDGRRHFIGGGRYLDKYVLSEQGWQFKHRKIVADYELEFPAALPGEGVIDEQTARGGTGKNDPAAEFFTLF